ncbi:hypothetical protein OCV51_01495 [Faecalicatena acetigenes]|uniref:Phage protein n=1 Tax=Faecalicatena acetigenes TaxID=2981790 RepID=A0ABT2T7U8_9FIRM|nr:MULTISPECIES: hypothetical protein [Lachnospiraceae]MCU6746343.1 hypothetical protein [Faecalicatena acetigenes]SCH13517.1 Uncharacterised protein [uncultured Clostridium sp.]
MAKIKGITITLITKEEAGRDGFDHPIYVEKEETVENVLVSPVTATEAIDALDFEGKKAIYNIAIPKGDQHTWKDQIVEFFGDRWQVIGFPKRGIEENIPLDWNDIWQVAKYE